MKITPVDLDIKAANIRGACERPLMELCFSGELDQFHEDLHAVLNHHVLYEVQSDLNKSKNLKNDGSELFDVVARKFNVNFLGQDFLSQPQPTESLLENELTPKIKAPGPK